MKKMKVLVLFGLLAIVVTPSVHSQTFDPYKSKMAIQMSLNPCSDEESVIEDTFNFKKILSRLESCKKIDINSFKKLKFNSSSIYLVWVEGGSEFWGVAYPNFNLDFLFEMELLSGSTKKIDTKKFYEKIIEVLSNCDN